MTAQNQPLLSIRNLKISIATDEGNAEILDHVQLDIPRGKIIGVAGESGCGKSTLVRAILGILPRQAVINSGEIIFNNQDLLKLPKDEMRHSIRGRKIGFIPQDPFLALNPVFKVGAQLLEILRSHGMPDEPLGHRYTKDIRKRHTAHLVELLRAVQVPDPEQALERYPHEFSGGQRQRLLIAGSLACRPELILADEPTTALDVTTQLQILKLLKDLAEEFGLSMLFVTHDFGVIAQLCDQVSVMYAGQTAETGNTATIINKPIHPYTQMLMACHPDRLDTLAGIPGQVPSPLTPPSGCRFGPRCPSVSDICRTKRPPVVVQNKENHSVACVLHSQGIAT